MDVLTDILDNLQFKANFYFRTDLTTPWSVYIPVEPNVARFHIVTRGQGWIQVEGQSDYLPIANGDMVVVPHGAAHTILDDPVTPPRPLEEVLATANYKESPLVYGGNGPNTGLVCGEFKFDDAIHPLLADLPPILHVSGSDSRNQAWFDSALGFIAQEALTGRAGSLAIINRLSEIIFIQVIRAFADASDSQIPFLAALGDPQISQVLSAIHRQPAADMSVESLGQLVGMSRSSFSNHFTDLVGMTPYQYLTLVRMQQASRTLVATDDSIMTVSIEAGYKSEAAFSGAFKRFFGMRPGEYRKQRKAVKEGSETT